MQPLRILPLSKTSVAVATGEIHLDISMTADGLKIAVREDGASIPTPQIIRVGRDLTARIEQFDETEYREISAEIPA
jgi:hypothetical protein